MKFILPVMIFVINSTLVLANQKAQGVLSGDVTCDSNPFTTPQIQQLSQLASAVTDTMLVEELAPMTALEIAGAGNQGFKLTLRHPEKVGSTHRYVLEFSTDLKKWTPIKVFIPSNMAGVDSSLTDPMQGNRQFYRATKTPLPTGTLSAGPIMGDEDRGYIVMGNFIFKKEEIAKFPSKTVEVGIVGLNGQPIYSDVASYAWQSPVFRTKQEAEIFRTNARLFVKFMF